jgi:molybdate transport system ATP-binding protein
MSLVVALRHRFGGFDLDVSFEAPAGVTALFGRSGAGKTTVVNAVAGLLSPDEGHIAVNGETLLDTARGIDLPAHRRRIGYVFQDGRLFPHLTVRRNLLYGHWFAAEKPPAARFSQITGLLGIDHLLERRTGALSGGEKQRVAIGRAILANPRLLLMDEPLAALDAARKSDILPYIERLRDETGLPILYVSHAVGEIARLADTVVVLDEGRVTLCGPADTVFSDPVAAPAFGAPEAGALLRARVAAHDPDDALTELEVSAGRIFVPLLDTPVGGTVRVRVGAGDVTLAREAPEGLSALNILPATVVEMRPEDGPGELVSLRSGDDRLLARVTRRSIRSLGLAPGVSCHAILKTTRVTRDDVGH